jgi:hypothetical protein
VEQYENNLEIEGPFATTLLLLAARRKRGLFAASGN